MAFSELSADVHRFAEEKCKLASRLESGDTEGRKKKQRL